MWLAPTVCLPAESDLVEAIVEHDGSGPLVVVGGPSESDLVEVADGLDVSGPLVVGLDVVGPLVVGLDGPLVVTLGEPVA